MKVWLETFILWGMAVNVRNIRLWKYLSYTLVTWKKQYLHRKWTKPLNILAKVAKAYLLPVFLGRQPDFCSDNGDSRFLILYDQNQHEVVNPLHLWGGVTSLFAENLHKTMKSLHFFFLRSKCIIPFAGNTWKIFSVHSALQRTFSCSRGKHKALISSVRASSQKA